MPRVSTKLSDEPELEVITTRVPVKVQTRAKTLATLSYNTLTNMHIAAIDRFLLEKPWRRGLRWSESRSLTGRDEDMPGHLRATGWIQTNFRLPPATKTAIENLSFETGQSISSILYTAMKWWLWFVHPDEREIEKRTAVALKSTDHAVTKDKSLV